MAAHPTVLEEVDEAVSKLLAPFMGRRKVLFAGWDNTCRSQIASAFAQMAAGDRLEVVHGGVDPGSELNPDMVQVMQEKGIDMEFRSLQSIAEAISQAKPDIIVTIGCSEQCPQVADARIVDWELDDPTGKSIDVMRAVRDDIERRVSELIDSITY
jgi:protein-tyrosine-phosphatase